MACRNQIKLKIQNIFLSWLNMFSIERKLTDNQKECMQFGICDYAPRQVEEIPLFSLLIQIH